MFRSIWQIIRVGYSRRRSGIDSANIEHLRADLRFRLAMMEYAYYGRSGRRVAMCLEELKTVLGEKAMHRYLRSLDPDLRTQFVERFQGARRQGGPARRPRRAVQPNGQVRAAGSAVPHGAFAANVVPFDSAARRSGAEPTGTAQVSSSQPNRSADSGD